MKKHSQFGMRKWAFQRAYYPLRRKLRDIGEGPSGPNTEIFYDRGEAYGNDFSDPNYIQAEKTSVT